MFCFSPQEPLKIMPDLRHNILSVWLWWFKGVKKNIAINTPPGYVMKIIWKRFFLNTQWKVKQLFQSTHFHIEIYKSKTNVCGIPRNPQTHIHTQKHTHTFTQRTVHRKGKNIILREGRTTQHPPWISNCHSGERRQECGKWRKGASREGAFCYWVYY